MERKKLVTELKNKLSRQSVLASYAIFYSKYASEGLTNHFFFSFLNFFFHFFINVYVSVNVLVRAMPRRSGGYMLQISNSLMIHVYDMYTSFTILMWIVCNAK